MARVRRRFAWGLALALLAGTAGTARGDAAADEAAFLEALESLPCGCVAASFRAMPWALELVRLEAKGPHCFHLEHTMGSVLSLGSGEDLDELPDLP